MRGLLSPETGRLNECDTAGGFDTTGGVLTTNSVVSRARKVATAALSAFLSGSSLRGCPVTGLLAGIGCLTALCSGSGSVVLGVNEPCELVVSELTRLLNVGNS